MGLSEVQRLLAQLYTSAALREQFAREPRSVAAQFGLTEAELEEVTRISQRQLKLFAASLHGKRFGEISKLLPLTQQVLGPQLRVLFQSYADSYIPGGVKKHRDDAIHFAAYLEQVARAESLGPAWLGDLIRYERARLQAGEITRRLTLYTSRYTILDLARALQLGEEHPTPHRRPTLILWLRLTPHATLRTIVSREL